MNESKKDKIERLLNNISEEMKKSYSKKRNRYLIHNLARLIKLNESGKLEKQYIEALEKLISDLVKILQERNWITSEKKI